MTTTNTNDTRPVYRYLLDVDGVEISPSALCRWMGFNFFSAREAFAVLATFQGVKLHPGTVYGHVRVGRLGDESYGSIPELSVRAERTVRAAIRDAQPVAA